MAGNKYQHKEFQEEIPPREGEKGYKKYCKLNKTAKKEHDLMIKKAELYNKYNSDVEYLDL